MHAYQRHALLLAAVLADGFAHEVPADVDIHILLKQDPRRIQALLRVPLRSIRDVAFPESAKGNLEVEKLLPNLPAAIQVSILDRFIVYQGADRLPAWRLTGTQISLPSDRSFISFPDALNHIQASKPSGEGLRWDQVYLDVAVETKARSDASTLAIESSLDHLAARVATTLQHQTLAGATRAYHWTSNPGRVELDPSWFQSASTFVALGFWHILEGTDHLLFVLCLLLPFQRLRDLLWTVTAFTVAHSITLTAAAYRWGPQALWFPPLVETLIAASILYMALENLCREPKHRWTLAFAFGLLHGFGFSFALAESLQFAGSHLLLSLLSFNVGVEFGQFLVLLLAYPLLRLQWGLKVRIVICAWIAHTSWHWLLERGEQLRQFSFPVMSTADVVSLLRWAALLVTLSGVAVGWQVWRRGRDSNPR